MGYGDACPALPGMRYLDWELPDPNGLSVDEVRPVREEIEQRISGLLLLDQGVYVMVGACEESTSRHGG